MKKNISNHAFTLIELIIALVLISVILLGIFSISSVLSNNNQDFGQKYLVKSETQAALNNILNNASLAVGSGTTDSFGNLLQGILIGTAGVGDANTFCFHQGAGTDNNIIHTTTNDIWACYTWYPATDPTHPNQIMWCTFTYPTATNPAHRGTGSCSTAPTQTFLGTAYNNPAPTYTTATNTFKITITNCLDNSTAGTCNSGTAPGTSSDPANNPEAQLSGSVIPPQEGTS